MHSSSFPFMWYAPPLLLLWNLLQWLRHQSKDFYAASLDVLVKRWDKCINVGGGYVKK
jgi:hypothetical protein